MHTENRIKNLFILFFFLDPEDILEGRIKDY